MTPIRCAYCKRLQRKDQLVETQTGKGICFDCCEKYNLCEVCGSTTEENFTASGQNHFDEMCFQ